MLMRMSPTERKMLTIYGRKCLINKRASNEETSALVLYDSGDGPSFRSYDVRKLTLRVWVPA